MDKTKLKAWFQNHLDDYRNDPELGDQWRSYLFEDGFGECGGDWDSEEQKDEAGQIMREVIACS